MNQHARPGVVTTASFVGGLVGVFSDLHVVQQVASAFEPRPVVTALLTVGIALVSALVAHWQSIARGAAPDATLIAPRGPDELKELLSADPRLQVNRCRRILWLDDLPQYVDTLDQPALDRLGLFFPAPR